MNPYNYAENSPIANIDLHGLQSFYAADGSLLHAGPLSESSIRERGLTPIPLTTNSVSSVQEDIDFRINTGGANGAIQPIGFVDAAAIMVEGLLFECGKLLGLDNKDAALAATTVLVINDIRGLKIDKVIRNVDDLVEAAGNFTTPRSGTKSLVGENKIQADINDVFDKITEGGEVFESGAVRLQDGRIVHQHVSRDTGQGTITIDKEGEKLKKVRFKDQ